MLRAAWGGWAALLLLTGPAAATWQEDLTWEIEKAENCKVALITQIVERTIEDRHLVMAKVHCEDKRTFDAIRRSDFDPFEFRRCEGPDTARC